MTQTVSATTTTLTSGDGPSTETGGVVVVDFGGQYAQLIARRVRELGAFSRVVRHDISPAEMDALDPAAIILSGGPSSVYAEDAPSFDEQIVGLGRPMLGICYGMQLLAQALGGSVERTGGAEYGKTDLRVSGGTLLAGLGETETVWMSHRDAVVAAPEGAMVTATTPGAPIAAFESVEGRWAGVQFHPEVVHTPAGTKIIDRFLDLAQVPRTWTAEAVIEEQVRRIREQVGDRHVLCALSGGVDSSVAAMLVYRAIGDQLTCVFVDHGLLRKDEAHDVVEVFGNHFHVPLIHVDARDRFLELLAGVEDPEEKRRRIGEAFIRVFEEEARALEAEGGVDFLVQGTLYSDVIESGGVDGVAAKIKSHHNVGGLPEDIHFDLIEPLRTLFKDEVRKVGEALGLPATMVWRQPFPGPGLAIRIIGDVTEERLEIVRESDAILREEVARAGLDRELWQYFTVLPAIRSVGVQGDARTYAYPIVIRAVSSEDAMTADWARLPYDLIERVSSRIINEVEHVNRVVLDVSSKPPSTIEWE